MTSHALSDLAAAQAAAADAAAAEAAAAHAFVIELWTLYSLGVFTTILRTYARIRQVGIKKLRPDDYLIWVAILFYSALSALAYNVGNVAHGLANTNMTDAERAGLPTDNSEYHLRVVGSQIQVAGWTTYTMLMWTIKATMLFLFMQITDGLGRRYRIRIFIGFGLVVGTFIACILAIFLSCMPFQKYWQINPNPGNSCQAAISLPIIWTSFAGNVSTDIYLLSIPIPLLWESTLKLPKKIASTVVLGAGIFCTACATMKSIFVLVDSVTGPQTAGAWGTREAFVAVVITNLPRIFPLLKDLFRPLFGSASRSTKYSTPSGFRTIGGGSNNRQPNSNRPSQYPNSKSMTFNDSEERIVDDVKLQDLKTPAPHRHTTSSGIIISKDVEIVTEDEYGHKGDPHAERVHETW